MHRHITCLAVVCALLSTGRYVLASVPVARKLHGIAFGPYIDGQNPNTNPYVTPAQLESLLTTISSHTSWIRSYGMTNGLEQVPVIARSLGLKVAAGAWLSADLAANQAEIQNLITAAQAGNVDVAIIGSEVLLRGDLTESELITYIDQVRNAVPPGVLVGTAETYNVLLSHPSVISAGTAVIPHIYPFWQGLSLSVAICSLASAYNNVLAASGGRPVIVGETGWPTAGGAINAAVPSTSNASTYALQFVTWAQANSVAYFMFEAFDEAWKSGTEGSVGPHWGIWQADRVLKPGMQALFDGQLLPVSCDGIPGGPGTPSMNLTYVPSHGSFDHLEGQVLHVLPSNHKVAVYIRVGAGWWTKPTFAQPLTSIESDGTWSTDVVTGGSDHLATELIAFLLPNGYTPPLLQGQVTLPATLFTDSVANAHVTRSTHSISGKISNLIGNPEPGIALSLTGETTGMTQTTPTGKYSFPILSGAGPYQVAPISGTHTFTPAMASFSSVAGRVIVDFLLTGTKPIMTGMNPGRAARGRHIGPVTISGMHFTPEALVDSSLPGSQVTIESVGVVSATRIDISFETTVAAPIGPVLFTVTTSGGSSLPFAFMLGERDFDGDAVPDFVWQEDTSRVPGLWYLESGGIFRSGKVIAGPQPGWSIVGVADLNSDGHPDLIWQHDATRAPGVWYMGGSDGSVLISGKMLAGPQPGWRIVGAADLDRDGHPDLIWQEDTTRAVGVWYMGGNDGGTFIGGRMLSGPQPGWRVVGSADLNLDGHPDLIWQQDTTRAPGVWYMGGSDGGTFLDGRMLSGPQPGWRIVGPK